MLGIGLHGQGGDRVFVGAWVVVEAMQTEAGPELGGDRLVRVIAAGAGIDRQVGPLAALEDGRVLGIAQLSRIIDLDDEVGKVGGRGGELVLTPALIGVCRLGIEWMSRGHRSPWITARKGFGRS